jgi:DNA-binding response OmpR family regulator
MSNTETQSNQSQSTSADHGGPPTILLVEDDLGALQVFQRALEHLGFKVVASGSGQWAIDHCARHQIDLVVMDLNLPDMSGIDCIRNIRDQGHQQPFVLVSAFLTIEISVAAMRLGAFDVLEKPVAIERLAEAVRGGLRFSASDSRLAHHVPEAMPVRKLEGPSGSAAQRWAMYVIRGCEAEEDLRTIHDWARFAGVSYSTLCEACRLVRIQPQAARDFARTLRARIKSAQYRCDSSVLLDVRDRRTLKVLLERAGPWFQQGDARSVLEFIVHQRFVPASNEGIRVLIGHFEKHSA